MGVMTALAVFGIGFLVGVLFWELRTRRMINRTFDVFNKRHTIEYTPRSFTLTCEDHEP